VTVADTVRIGPLYLADAVRCAELELLLFPGDDPWSAQSFRDALRNGHFYLAVRDGAELIGYGGLAVLARPPSAEAEIHTMAVHPDYQGHGLGSRLLTGLLAEADAIAATVFLEVRTDNEPARALYRGAGFEQIGIRRNYYRPSGADAFTMRRAARGNEAG
jgi:ribosomal-protein-alanine N-acetyltransferase